MQNNMNTDTTATRSLLFKMTVGLVTIAIVSGGGFFLMDLGKQESTDQVAIGETVEVDADADGDVDDIPSASVSDSSTNAQTAAVPQESTTTTPVATTPAATTTTPSTPTTEAQPVTIPVLPQKKYVDGTYSASGTYFSPEGKEQVSITLVIKDDKVVSATFSGSSENKTSEQYINMFASGFKEKVVGKSIDSISLSVVNGASLTPRGFMDALAKIKSQAKA